jgi:uncharacterized coiled-coil protein SlyX
MATLEERVAYLEGKVDEHGRALDGVRDAIVHLELRMDRRFEAIDRRFEVVEGRLDALDQKLDRRFGELERKLDQRFLWLVGGQMTTLLTVAAALMAAFFAR